MNKKSPLVGKFQSWIIGLVAIGIVILALFFISHRGRIPSVPIPTIDGDVSFVTGGMPLTANIHFEDKGKQIHYLDEPTTLERLWTTDNHHILVGVTDKFGIEGSIHPYDLLLGKDHFASCEGNSKRVNDFWFYVYKPDRSESSTGFDKSRFGISPCAAWKGMFPAYPSIIGNMVQIKKGDLLYIALSPEEHDKFTQRSEEAKIKYEQTPPPPPPPVCGNGTVEVPEQCDDGNTGSGDGCSATCTLEAGWACSGQPSVCVTSGIACANNVDDDGDKGIDVPGDLSVVVVPATEEERQSIVASTRPYGYGYLFVGPSHSADGRVRYENLQHDNMGTQSRFRKIDVNTKAVLGELILPASVVTVDEGRNALFAVGLWNTGNEAGKVTEYALDTLMKSREGKFTSENKIMSIAYDQSTGTLLASGGRVVSGLIKSYIMQFDVHSFQQTGFVSIDPFGTDELGKPYTSVQAGILGIYAPVKELYILGTLDNERGNGKRFFSAVSYNPTGQLVVRHLGDPPHGPSFQAYDEERGILYGVQVSSGFNVVSIHLPSGKVIAARSPIDLLGIQGNFQLVSLALNEHYGVLSITIEKLVIVNGQLEYQRQNPYFVALGDSSCRDAADTSETEL